MKKTWHAAAVHETDDVCSYVPKRAGLLGLGVVLGWVNGCGVDAAAFREGHGCRPGAAGLTITEIMADPAGQDAGNEWFELTNLGHSPIVVDRLELTIGSLEAPRHTTLHNLGRLLPCQILVLGDGAPGAAPIDASYGPLELPNRTGQVALSCRGVLATGVRYGVVDALVPAQMGCEEAPAPQAGRSLSRRGPAGGQGHWQQATGPSFDGVNVGSPQAANPPHLVCRQSHGAWRPLRRPAAGALRIQAVLANPLGADAGREWLQVSVAAQSSVDLNGLTVQAQVPGRLARQWRVETEDCVTSGDLSTVTLRFYGLLGPLPEATAAEGTLTVWGPTLPNAAMRLALGFSVTMQMGAEQHHPHADATWVWLDTLDLPPAVPGVPWVREPRCVRQGCCAGAPAFAWATTAQGSLSSPPASP